MTTRDQYIINTTLTDKHLTYCEVGEQVMKFDVDMLIQAIINSNEDFKRQFEDAHKYPAALLKNIPLKNLSGAVGECFGQQVAIIAQTIKKNPHEAGAPDFLPVVPSAQPWFDNPTQKYYSFGGFDTKSSFSNERKFVGVAASSHHDQTRTVLVVQWSYDSNGVPEIIGVFYTNELVPSDWRLSVGKPGSKTTNAATLTATGKDKLRKGWVVLHKSVTLPKRNNIKEQYGF